MPSPVAHRDRGKCTELPDSDASEPGSVLMPLRVLHINSGNLYGGVESNLVTLARLRHLCPEMEPCFAVCHESRLSEELVASGVAVHLMGEVRISRPWTVWGARRRLRDLLRREKFDLVICHMPWSLAVFGPVVAGDKQKLGFWAHGVHAGRHWLEQLARRATPDLAIASSRFTRASLPNLFRDVPAQLINYPVALIPAPEADQWRAAFRSEQKVDDDTVVIVQVSRLEAWKGHVLHLQALSELQNMGNWVCWIVGGAQKPEEERYLDELRQTAARLGITGRVHFLGQRSDVPKILAAADIFCQPNQGPEPFGIVFIEALWAGLPVVTTAMGGAMEIIDESCGLLVKPGDPTRLAESLRRLIEAPELRQSLGRAGAARAVELCDPATQMQKLCELARRAAAPRENAASQWS